MNNRRYSADLFAEGRKYLNDWETKMDDYARKRRMQSRRILRRSQPTGTKQSLTVDEEMQKIRHEKAKRRSSIKSQNEPMSDQTKMDNRKSEVRQFMEESKSILKRCDETLSKQVELALKTQKEQLEETKQAAEDLDKTLEDGRKKLAEMNILIEERDDTPVEELQEIRERLLQRRQSAPVTNLEESDEEPSLIQNEHDFELVQRMRQLELEIEKGRKIIEEREIKRSAFFKKQNKYYCQLVWKKLADENKDET